MPRFSRGIQLILCVAGLTTLSASSASTLAVDTPPAATSSASGAVRLRPKWEAGQTATYDMRIETRLKARILSDEGGLQSQLYRQEARLTRRVIKADAKSTVISVTIERLRMQVGAGGQVLWYDSASTTYNGDAPELKQAIDTAVGRPITITLDAAGEVTAIEGNQDPEPTNEEEAKKPRIPQAILGDQVIKSVWKPLFGIPGAPESASSGQTWAVEEQSTDRVMGIFHTKLTYTVATTSATSASVAVTGTTKLTPAMGTSAVKGEVKDYAFVSTFDWDVGASTLRSLVGRQTQSIEGERGTLKQLVETTVLRQFTHIDPAAKNADWGTSAPPRAPEIPEPAVEPAKNESK